MAENKTQATRESVTKFLDGIADQANRQDSFVLYGMMQRATKNQPRMWGESIVGFGEYHYVGKSGREGDWFLAGFSPRKQALTLYMLGGWEQHGELLAKLGKHSLGKGCLYIKRLADVDTAILNKLIVQATKRAQKQARTDARAQAKLKK